jgi:hypothetical protein
MRGNLWSRAPANRARPNRGNAWPEAPTGGGVPVDRFLGGSGVRDAGVLAGHGGITAGFDVIRADTGRFLPGDGQGPR